MIYKFKSKAAGDVIMLGLPDMKQKQVYDNDVKPNLKKGKMLKR